MPSVRDPNIVSRILSDDTSDYVTSLANPYDTGPKDARVPSFPALETATRTYWSKGTFTTGTLNFGFILGDPLSLLANDRNSVYGSLAAFPGSTTTIVLAANQVAGYMGNSEFTTASLGPNGIQGRIVSCGMRVRNITPKLSRGGQLFGLQEPAHASLDGTSLAAMQAYQESASCSPDSKMWTNLNYKMVDTDDNDFIAVYPGQGAGNLNATYICFIAIAPAGSPQTYQYEFWGNFEIQGRNVSGKGPSNTDATGFSAVSAVSALSPAMHQPHQISSEDMAHGARVATAHYALTHHTGAKPENHPSLLEDIGKIANAVIPEVRSAIRYLGAAFV